VSSVKRKEQEKMTRKITVLTLCAMLIELCGSVGAQQPTKMARIGYLGAASPSSNTDRIEAFRQGLREVGYIEGKNIIVEYRYAEEKFDRLPTLAAELVGLKVRHYRLGWLGGNTSSQRSNRYHSHCHDE
jgi:putative ABC transport system substrate-binding protein